jgi:hypothetical protein
MHVTGKPVVMLAESSVTNGGTVTARVDTLGFKQLTLIVRQSTSDTTSHSLSTVKLGQGDVTNSTSATDITKFVGGGAGGFTIPAADASNPQVYMFNVDLRGKSRYIFLTLTPQTTQTFTAVALLTKGENIKNTASDYSIAALIEG